MYSCQAISSDPPLTPSILTRSVPGVSEIDLDALAHNRLAIEDMSDTDLRIVIIEGDDDALESAERSPGVDWDPGVDEVFDSLEVVCSDDLGVSEVGY